MKYFLFTLFALVGLTTHMTAQKITGVAQLKNGQPAEYATVTLHKVSDSTLVKGSLAGDDGTFELLKADAGRYFVRVKAVGAATGDSPAFDYNGSEYKTLETIVLPELGTALSEVAITARRPVVEVKADKTILNVEGTVNSTGLSALELLRKAPGVTVDNNENISVKGKNAVRVLIDGRETPLDGKDLASLLKGLQASDIASIEIISNPSAKYDAAGNAGIVNIKMRKNKSMGTNGNINLEGIYGETLKGGGSTSLNYRGKKIGAFGSYNTHYGRWHNSNDFVREQSGLKFDQASKSYNQNRWNSVRTGADWFINSKHTIGTVINANFDNGTWHSRGTTRISNLGTPDNIDSLLVASNDQTPAHNYNFNANLNYRYADTSGHTLSVDIDRGQYEIRGRSLQPNYYRTVNGEPLSEAIFSNNTPTDINITTAKTDYEQTLWKGSLGAGAKVAMVATDNTFDFFNVINGTPVKNLNVSNRFKYSERTSAAYLNYNRKFGKLGVQTGLRLESTHYEGDLITETQTQDTSFSRTYTKLFPSAALTYEINKKIGVNATYSRRIDRPSYQDLNPFENKLDELTYQKGNFMLRPQFTNSFEISPTYQGFPVVTLGYSYTTDVFTQVIKTSPSNARATFITQENLADQKNYTASLNFPTPIAKWWEGFVSVTGIRSHFTADFGEGFTIDKTFNTMNLYSEQSVKLPHDWKIQLSGFWNSPGFWGTFKSSAQGVMDFGVQKKVLDGKGELRFRAGDILRTARWRGENIFTPGLRMDASGTWEAHTYTVSFNYRFGSNEVKAAGQRKTGLEDEKNRVKSGRN